MGLDEEKQGTFGERKTELETTVKGIMETLGCRPDSAVAMFYRLGKYDSNRRRPILLRMTTMWEKRKALLGFQGLKGTGQRRLPFFLKEDRPLTEIHKKAKEEAAKLNAAEQKKARRENREVVISYSGRDDGNVVEYQFRDGGWRRIDKTWA